MGRAKITKDVDRTEEILEGLKELEEKAVVVGVPSDTERQVIIRASVHEYGSSRHPEVAFIRRTADQNKNKINEIYRDGVAEILEGKVDAEEVHGRVGKFLVGVIQANISRAGLIDTGQMYESISYEVVDM